MSELEKPMTPDEVAEHLRITTRTVKRLIASGKLKAIRYGRTIRILKEDFEQFRREGTCEATANEQDDSSSGPAGKNASSTSAGTTQPLDRRMVFQLALQTSKRRASNCSSTHSQTSDLPQPGTSN